jgi:hypothetical protein
VSNLTVKLTFDLGRWWLAGSPVGSNRSATQPLAIHRGDRTLGLLRNKLRAELSQRRDTCWSVGRPHTWPEAQNDTTHTHIHTEAEAEAEHGGPTEWARITQITSKGANYRARCLTRHGSSSTLWRAIYLPICGLKSCSHSDASASFWISPPKGKGKKRKWKLHTRGLHFDRFIFPPTKRSSE